MYQNGIVCGLDREKEWSCTEWKWKREVPCKEKGTFVYVNLTSVGHYFSLGACQILPPLVSVLLHFSLVLFQWTFLTSKQYQNIFFCPHDKNLSCCHAGLNVSCASFLSRWLFTGISRCKAEELLMQANNQSGTFLIRESETNKGVSFFHFQLHHKHI